jgi:hypothetical protein
MGKKTDKPRPWREFPMRTHEVADVLGEKPERVNQLRTAGIIPAALVHHEQANGYWRFKDDAVDWAALGLKMRVWGATDEAIVAFFNEAIARCGGEERAIDALSDAFDASETLDELTEAFRKARC